MITEREFEAALTDCYSRLIARAQRVTGNRADAEDAVQSALLSAYRGLASFRGEAKLESWLTRVVINKALEQLRRKHGRSRMAVIVPLGVPAETDRAAGEEIYFEPVDDSAGPEHSAMAAELAEGLIAAIEGMKPARRAVMCRVILGDTLQEIAEATRASLPAVKSNLFRARNTLAEMVARP